MESIEIPERLKVPELRFTKVKAAGKRAIEKGCFDDYRLTEASNYAFDDTVLLNHIKNGGNYGVVPTFGPYVVIDCDTKELRKLIEDVLPSTFTVKTGSGGTHHYFKSDIENNYVLYDPEDPDDTNRKNVGDIQKHRKQVVGPNCVHPNGNRYKVINDVDIETIFKADLIPVLDERGYLKKQKQKQKVKKRLSETTDIPPNADIDNIPLQRIVNTTDQRWVHTEDGMKGPHPIHGSKNGQNLALDLKNNVWHCFRHDTGGGPAQWIAVEEGIIDCGESVPGALRHRDRWRKVLDIAHERYGLERPTNASDEDIQPDQPKEKKDFFAVDPWKKFHKKNEHGTTKFIPLRLGGYIQKKQRFITLSDTEEFRAYDNGIYTNNGDVRVKSMARKLLKDSRSIHKINETINDIKETNYVCRDEVNPDDKLCLENGIYNLDTREFRDHTPEVYFTTKLPINYDPEADCPKIKQFLEEVAHPEDIPLIQEIIGYTLFPGYPFHKAVMLHGGGANGKSTFLELLKNFVGAKNTSGVQLQKLDDDKFARAELYGKMTNICADLPPKRLYYTGVFKMLSGGDMVEAERKYQDPFRFNNRAKLLFSANELPPTSDLTDAYFRRWLIIDFPNTFKGSDADPNLLSKLTTDGELSGLFNWALEGLERLLEQGGFTKSTAQEEIKDRWIKETDSLRSFVMAKVEEDEENYVSKDAFMIEYKKWCKSNNLGPVSKEKIGRDLPTLCNAIKGRRRIMGNLTYCWDNIKIKDSDYNKGKTTDQDTL